MSMSQSEISDLSENNLSLAGNDSQPGTQRIRISADRYTLLSITALPSSSKGIQTPQTGCIYVDPVKGEYIALSNRKYDRVVILGSSIQFNKNVKTNTATLYLVEEMDNIILYHYDGSQWCSIAREKGAVLEALKDFDGQEGESCDQSMIEMIASFYGCRLLRGKLEGLTPGEYKPLPITSIPSSSNGIQTPQPGCIYVDLVKGEYIALSNRKYDRVVILGSSIQFDENAKMNTTTLYLIEEMSNIILYHYDGSQWCSIAKKKGAALDTLRVLDGQEGENYDPSMIEMIASFYGCHLLTGKLEGFTLNKLDPTGLKEAIIEQRRADFSRNRKRRRDMQSVINGEPSSKTRRCLEDEFQNISVGLVESDSDIDIFAALPVITEPDQMAVLSPLGSIIDLTDTNQPVNPIHLESAAQTIHSEPSPLKSGDTLCTARVSSGLGPAQYRFNFWETRLDVGNSNTEIDISVGNLLGENPVVENLPAARANELDELIERVERGDTTAYYQYATLLETGSGEIEKNEDLADYFFRAAAEAEGQQEKRGRLSPAF